MSRTFPGQDPKDYHVARRVLTVFAWIITLLLATVLNIHFLTGMNQNKTDVAELRGELEKWHVVASTQRDDIKALRRNVRYALDNIDVNVTLLDDLKLRIKELRRDLINLDKGDQTDASAMFEKLKKLRADVMIINKNTHNLRDWLSRVDADLDPGYLAMLETQIVALERKVR